MIVVCDSSALIYLAAISRFDLLQLEFGRVIIPDAVYDEVVVHGAGRWGAAETIGANWIERRTVSDPGKVAALQTHLQTGECEVVVLAGELSADLVVMDDAAGRHELSQRGIGVIGTAGVLISAKRHNMIPALQPELDRLRAAGFHLGDKIYGACLARVGE